MTASTIRSICRIKIGSILVMPGARLLLLSKKIEAGCWQVKLKVVNGTQHDNDGKNYKRGETLIWKCLGYEGQKPRFMVSINQVDNEVW